METRITSSTFNRQGIAFGMDLLRSIQESRQYSNLIISPVSIHLALGLAHMAANGTTKDEMTKSLRLYDEKVESAKAFYRLMCKYKTDDRILVASKIYVAQDKPVKPKIQKRAKKWFQSEVENIDFKNQIEAAGTINQWVEGKTNGKINPVIIPEKLNEDASVIIVSAIYFKANWGQPFDKAKTTNGEFALNDTETVQVPMMSGRGPFKYAKFKSLNCVAVELPFENPDLSMLILLPNKKSGIDMLKETLFQKDLYMYRKRLKNSDTEVVIPKFRIENDLELSEYLKAIGMSAAFDEASADFSDLADGKPFITQVIHKTFIDVSEDGVDTNTPKNMTLPSAENPNYVSVSHPFLCAIMSKKHRLFFLATVRNPSENQNGPEPNNGQNNDQNIQKEENDNGPQNVQDETKDGAQSNMENGTEPGKQNGIENDYGNGAKNDNGAKNGNGRKNSNGSKKGNRNGAKNGNQNGAKNGNQNGAKNGNQNGSKNGNQNGAKNGNQNGSKNGNQNGPKNGNQNGPKNGAGNGTKNGNQNGIKNGTQNGIKNGKPNGFKDDGQNNDNGNGQKGIENDGKNGFKNNEESSVKNGTTNGTENNGAGKQKDSKGQIEPDFIPNDDQNGSKDESETKTRDRKIEDDQSMSNDSIVSKNSEEIVYIY